MTIPASWRGPLTWSAAIVVALALLVAVGLRVNVPGVGGGVLQSTYLVRVGFALAALGVAFVSRRRASRPELVGLWALAAALLLTAAGDWTVAATAPPGRLRDVLGIDVGDWIVFGNAVSGLVGILLPAIVGGRALQTGWDLARPPPVSARPLVVAVVAGLLLAPSVAFARAYGETAIWALRHEMGAPGTHRIWPTPSTASAALPLTVSADPSTLALFLRLGVELPAIEVLFHGTLRAAFGRWGLVPFVVATAFCAALLAMDLQPNFAVFVGALATGLLAARSGSVIPGFLFWQAVYVGSILWSAALGS